MKMDSADSRFFDMTNPTEYDYQLKEDNTHWSYSIKMKNKKAHLVTNNIFNKIRYILKNISK